MSYEKAIAENMTAWENNESKIPYNPTGSTNPEDWKWVTKSEYERLQQVENARAFAELVAKDYGKTIKELSKN